MRSYSKYYYIFAVLVIILSSWTVYYTLPGPATIYLAVFAIWILLRNNFHFEKSKMFYAFIFGILIIWNFLPRGSSSEDGGLISSFANMLILPALFLMNNTDREKIFDKYLSALTIIVGVGLVFHIFQLIGFQILSPISTNYIAAGERSFIVYPTHSNLIVRGYEINRFSSIFDEPGYLGTILAFTLCIERYDLRKLKNRVLFLTGIFTLSGAFFGLTIIYFVLSALYVRKLKIWQISLLIGVFVITIIYLLLPEIFVELTGRFIIERGEGLEDSRANISAFKQYIEEIQSLDNELLLWGRGRFALPSEYGIIVGHVSWVHLVIRLGLIFFIYLLVLLIITAIRTRNYFTMIFILLFIFSMNHRPQIFNLIYFFLLTCGIFLVPMREKQLEKL